MKIILSCLLISFFVLIAPGPAPAPAWQPRLEEESFLDTDNPAPLVGHNRLYQVGSRETLIALARRSGTGYEALVRANPGIDPWLPGKGTKIFLPYSFILPNGAKEGITINLAELRLYYMWQEAGRMRVRAYAVGIGRQGWDTPQGSFTIASRVTSPSWTPPPALRAESPELPSWIPPGPNNPLGDYWLGLSLQGYGIHGTSKPYGVGRRVSHGCLRLYPEDIEDLFLRAQIGTPVRIIDQPVKVGLKGSRLFLEVHAPATDQTIELEEEIMRQVAALPWHGRLDRPAIRKALQERRGIPTLISF